MRNTIKLTLIFLSILLLFSCNQFTKQNVQDSGKKTTDIIAYLGQYILPGSPYLVNMIVSNDDKNLYCSSSYPPVSIYKLEINQNGSLSQSGNSSVPSFIFNLDNNNNLYVANNSTNCVDVYDSNLNFKNSFGPFPAGETIANNIVISPDNKNLYVPTKPAMVPPGNYTLNGFYINNGSLNAIGNFSFAYNVANTYSAAMSKDGLFLYYFEANDYFIYKRNPENGNISQINNVAASYALVSPVMSNDQNYIYGIDGSLTAANVGIVKLTRNLKKGSISGNFQTLINDSSKSFQSLALSNDNKKLYYISGGVVSFGCYNLENNQIEFTYQPSGIKLLYIAVSKNDRFIYVGYNDGTNGGILTFERIIN